ncbi:MAG: hypothetical protein KDD60_06195, partial [Bdellovibrionales bacterium]|nr:hypothetical protein [Bdellovibrionales bacterium]
LSSGEKSFISDAAAGAIAAQIDSELAIRSAAGRNTQDFVSIAELRDSALSNISDLQTRQAELATQAASGQYSDEQRAVLDQEFQANAQEIERITATTEFNGNNLFSGQSLTAQVGVDSNPTSQISLSAIDVSKTFQPKSIATQDAAKSAVERVKVEQSSVTQVRGEDGAVVNRLETAAKNNETIAEGLTAARSRLRDVDVAEESANLVRLQIQEQSGVALQAQANLSARNVLNLLK